MRSPMVMLLGLMVMTAGFFLTMAGWFAPVKNDAVLKVRLTGPLCLGTGFALLILSCLCCAIEQNNCECTDSSKDVVCFEIEELPQNQPVVVQDMRSICNRNQVCETSFSNTNSVSHTTPQGGDQQKCEQSTPLDRRKHSKSSSSHRSPYLNKYSRQKYTNSPFVHFNSHAKIGSSQSNNVHKGGIGRPQSYMHALNTQELSDTGKTDPWEMQC